jgi:hypothetical protein
MNTAQHFNAIIEHLKVDAGLTNAYVEYMGGGILCIWIPCGKFHLVFGTANETWGADVYKDDEFQDGWSLNLTCPSDESDPSAVALALAIATHEFDVKVSQ